MRTGPAGGWTLLELLVVLAILGMVAGLGLAALGRSQARAALQEGAAQLTRLVAQARAGARETGTCWQLSAAGSQVTLSRFEAAVCAENGAHTARQEALPDSVEVRLSGGSDPMRFVPPYGTTDGSPNEYALNSARYPELRRTVRVTGVFARVIVR